LRIIERNNNTSHISKCHSYSKGWVVRIYHELKSDDVESWRVLNNVLDSGTIKSSHDHIDLCNTTQVIRNRALGNIFEMTWRWVIVIKMYFLYCYLI
jgi:hypothetical protein